MKHYFTTGYVTFIREPHDPKFYGMVYAKGEHALFHFLKKELNKLGFDLIKKRMQKDGHMMGDEYQPYLRTRNKHSKTPHIYIYSPFYQLRGANKDWNNGQVTFHFSTDIFNVGQNTFEMLKCYNSSISLTPAIG